MESFPQDKTFGPTKVASRLVKSPTAKIIGNNQLAARDGAGKVEGKVQKNRRRERSFPQASLRPVSPLLPAAK